MATLSEVGRAQADAMTAQRYEQAWCAFYESCAVGEAGLIGPRIFAWGEMQLSCLIRLRHAPAEVLTSIRRAQRELGRLAGVMVHPEYFLHITVRMFGSARDSGRFHVCEIETPDGVVSSEEIDAALQDVMRGIDPFRIELRGVNSWHKAPFVEVYAGGMIAEIRRRIAEALPALEDREYAGGFAPHLSLGYYCAGADLRAVAETIAGMRGRPFGEFEPHSLELVWSQGRSPYPELTTLREYPLRG